MLKGKNSITFILKSQESILKGCLWMMFYEVKVRKCLDSISTLTLRIKCRTSGCVLFTRVRWWISEDMFLNELQQNYFINRRNVELLWDDSCFVCNVDVFSVVWLCKRAGRHAGADEDEWSSAKRCRREAGKNKTSLSFTRVNEDVRGFKAQLKCALKAKTLCFGVRNATKDLFSFPFHEVGQYWFLATLLSLVIHQELLCSRRIWLFACLNVGRSHWNWPSSFMIQKL